MKSKIIPHQQLSNITVEILENEAESPEIIKEGLSFLLNRYIENQNRVLANKIVLQIEKLLVHADCIGFPNERCTYYRLLNYWRAKCL
tara:strand:+ start:765 stop:1028 length:264 start_codon:yes stop_codon:yes gene_type:complete